MKVNWDQAKVVQPIEAQIRISFPVPGGGREMLIPATEQANYSANPTAYLANYFGVSEVDFIRWVETDGTPFCGETTKSGRKCRNIVSGGSQRSLRDWIELDGGCCAVHGGHSSSEGFSDRRRKYLE